MVWLIGNKGMLGTQLEEKLKKEKIEYTASDREVDITDINALGSYVSGKKIGWIINCSAYTAVDKAESEEELARRINATGVENIAIIAEKIGAKVIHFSTDYVYDGKGKNPWKETDPTEPLSAYGRTKLEGEQNLLQHATRVFIFRISWLYGVYGPNFVKTMLRLFKEKSELNVVSDQIGSPTYAAELVNNIVGLLKKGSEAYGIYQYADDGYISWYDFACRIMETGYKNRLIDKKISINPIPTDKYPTPARRPANSRMDKAKVKKTLGFRVYGWERNLKAYFTEWKKMDKIQNTPK